MSDDAGVPDLGAILQQAQAMQEQLLAAQQAAAQTVVEGQAGGGVVRIRVNGGYEFEAVEIQPEAVDPDDVTMLQDLVLAALRDAMARLADLQAEAMGDIGFDGLDLGGMLGPSEEA